MFLILTIVGHCRPCQQLVNYPPFDVPLAHIHPEESLATTDELTNNWKLRALVGDTATADVKLLSNARPVNDNLSFRAKVYSRHFAIFFQT